MPRLSADAWIALGLLASCGIFLGELMRSESSGAFVKTTTLPITLVIVLMGLAMLLLIGALRKGVVETATGSNNRAGLHRVGGMVVWIALYVAALPWAGYLTATAVFLVGASLFYGNRRWGVILAWAILLPVALLLFFEKFMIVLLPASRLMG